MNNRSYFALGIMTGTSLDGIDLSLCFTDGKTRLKNIKSSYVAVFQEYGSYLTYDCFYLSCNIAELHLKRYLF